VSTGSTQIVDPGISYDVMKS